MVQGLGLGWVGCYTSMRGVGYVFEEIKDVLRGGCIPNFYSGCAWIAGHLAVGPSRSRVGVGLECG